MTKTAQNTKHFDASKVLKSEPKFIDIYTNSTQIKPIKLLLGFFKGYYGKLLLSALFFFIKLSPTWALPIITSNVINIATQHPSNSTKMLIINFVIAAILLFQNIPTHVLYIKFFSESSRSVEAGLRGAMIRKLQQLSITFHKDMESGKIQSKVMRDVENIAEFTFRMFDSGLSFVITISITICVVVSHNIYVFLMFLVCIPLSVAIRQKFSKKMRKESHRFRKEMENTASAVYDMEELIPVTRAHALENQEVKKLTGDIIQIAESGFRLDKVQGLFGSVSWVIFGLFQIICLFFSSILAMKGKISIGEISLYQAYFAALTGQLSSLINLLPIIAKGTESISSIGEILSAYDIENNSHKTKIKQLNGKYEFRNIDFWYDERTQVLSQFNMEVKAGETVALVGESGSGKSTVLNLVIGFIKAQSGEVLIDGININQINLHDYRKFISVVPQNSILFSGSIKDNITYGIKNISDKQIADVVHDAQLDSVIDKLPNGIDTLVGEHGDKLSGGQKQRISIARAIIRNPKVIIFDEATSALDSVTEREIQKAIDFLTKDRTTFIVAHRLSTIKNADKIAVIKDGRCVEYGTYNELMEKKGEFYNYKKLQS